MCLKRRGKNMKMKIITIAIFLILINIILVNSIYASENEEKIKAPNDDIIVRAFGIILDSGRNAFCYNMGIPQAYIAFEESKHGREAGWVKMLWRDENNKTRVEKIGFDTGYSTVIIDYWRGVPRNIPFSKPLENMFGLCIGIDVFK